MGLSVPQQDRLISVSENYNTPKEHYKVITQLTTMMPKDASFIISKLEERVGDYNTKPRMNSFKIREINVGISKNPMKYNEYAVKENNDGFNSERTFHRSKFQEAIQKKEFDVATIHYLTLKDYKDKMFLDACMSKEKELLPFYSFMANVRAKMANRRFTVMQHRKKDKKFIVEASVNRYLDLNNLEIFKKVEKMDNGKIILHVRTRKKEGK